MQEFKAGVEYTHDSFLLNELMYFRKNVSVLKVSPMILIQSCSNTYHTYDIEKRICEQIETNVFFKAYYSFKKEGLNKKREAYLYDKAMEDDFILYFLLTSDHI